MEGWARKIIHVDMDAFFAAVEQRDNPELRGKPVIIGGRPDRRGVVSTCSYEARQFGVRSAMPLREAFRRCPNGIFLPGNHRKYSAVSRELQRIFKEYIPLVEPLSLDEAFLDVAGCEGLFGLAVEIGQQIKERISRETGLTASVGVSYNKFLAKLASDLEKPAGFVVIGPEDVERVLWPLPVRRIWGVGEIYRVAHGLFKKNWNRTPVRPVGVTVSKLASRDEVGQLAFFGQNREKEEKLAEALDRVRDKFGEQAVTRARLLK